METCDNATKKLGYSLLKGDPRYMYFTATEQFAPGPEEGTTMATWVATFSAAVENMGAPETIKSIVVSQWITTQEAALIQENQQLVTDEPVEFEK